MKRFIFLLFAGAMGLALPAQETIDILSLTGRYGIPREYNDAAYSGKATEWGSINSFTAGFKLSGQSMLAINVNHFYFNVQGSPEPDFPDDIANPVKVNGIILRTGLLQKFSKGRSLQVLVAPRLMSDFQNLDGNSFMFGGVLSYKKKFRDELGIGFGVIYNTELFGPYMVPFLDLDWQLSANWRIKGMIPITARVEYTVNENMLVGFNHFGLITTYALGNEAYAGDYMERQSIDLSLFIRQRLAGNIFVEGMAGYAVGRKYRQFEGDQKVDFAIPLVAFGDNRVVKNEMAGFDNGLILTLKLIYNMTMPD
ncbi:MAG: DUF6268 family outer membrane beta-barrel protein [Bacteroidota bacterium]